MKVCRSFEVKWYHLLVLLLGLAAITFVVLWFLLGRQRLVRFVVDETDIVS